MWVIPFVLLAVVITTGNVTVLIVFTRTPSLRKRKYYLLVSLAAADLLVGVISVPMYVTMLSVSNTTTLRKIYDIQDMLFGTASVFGLAAVAIERAYAVYFPFKHRTICKGAYMIGIAVVWLMATFIAFSNVFFNQLLIFYTANVPIAVSLAIIVISYFLIWIKMNYLPSVQGHAINERDKKLTVTLLVVTVISLIAWTPFQALMTYAYFCGRRCHYSLYVIFGAKFLHYSNSLVNPNIYALRMPQFKKELLCRLRSCVACNRSYEEDQGNTANANRTIASEIDRDHDNDVVNHVKYEEDHGNRPNTDAIIGGNNVNDIDRDNDVGNLVNVGDHDNGLRTLGNNETELELNTLNNHDNDVRHSNVPCREHEENIC